MKLSFLTAGWVSLASIVSASADLPSTNVANQQLCISLSKGSQRGKVFFPNSTKKFSGNENAYFSLQESVLTPACIARPNSTADVSNIVTAVKRAYDSGQNVTFAIRSGGIMPWSGAANVESGLTIDMREFNKLQVHPSRTSVKLGSGMTWGSVYQKLDAMQLAVTGARVASLGVGGFLLGGGYSYFSPRYGFACDNIIGAEVVLPSGKAVNVTKDAYSDIWLALRGGSNNFGIVTSFNVRSFEQGNISFGQVYYNVSTVDKQLAAYHSILTSPQYDPYASFIQSFGFSSGRGQAIVNALAYTKPELNPPVYANFSAIPHLMSTARITSLMNATVEEAGDFGDQYGQFQQLYMTKTFRGEISAMRAGFDAWNASLRSVSAVENITWPPNYHRLPPVITEKSAALGDDLGLANRPALIIALLSASYANAADTPTVQRAAEGLLAAIEDADRFLYLNYANRGQEPIASYGAANHARLLNVSRKYDPGRLFQKALPGGFKLE